MRSAVCTVGDANVTVTHDREAHVISKVPRRLVMATAELRKAGFTVRHAEPVLLDDPRVQSLARQYLSGRSSELTASVSASLTHGDLWSRFPSRGEWLYVFEDDTILNSLVRADLVPYVLSAAEEHATAQRSAIIYLAMNGLGVDDFPEKRNRSYRTSHPAVRCDGNRPMFLRPCATLSLNAYAIRRGAASKLWWRIRSFLSRSGKLRANLLHQLNLDTNARLFYQKGGAPPEQWPTCIASRSLAFRDVGSLFVQNGSEPSTIRHYHR